MCNQVKNVKNILKDKLKLSLNKWYLPVIYGVCLILLGGYVLSESLEVYITLTHIFGVSILFGGALEVYFAFSNKKKLPNYGWVLALGIIDLIVGVLLFQHPEVVMTTLLLFIGFWTLFRSFSAIGYAMNLDSLGVSGAPKFLLSGIVGIIVGMLLIFNPIFTGLSIIILTSLCIILSGIFNIMFGIKFRVLHKEGGRLKKMKPQNFIKKHY